MAHDSEADHIEQFMHPGEERDLTVQRSRAGDDAFLHRLQASAHCEGMSEAEVRKMIAVELWATATGLVREVMEGTPVNRTKWLSDAADLMDRFDRMHPAGEPVPPGVSAVKRALASLRGG